jgi:ABC-type polysaccharide/polyol phosphate export permease
MALLAGLTQYCREIWKRRYFWWTLARLDLAQRYHGSVLGVLWSLLHPLGMTAILCIVFVGVFKADVRTYIPFLLCGLAPWTFISGAFVEGCNSIRQAEKFMRVYPAPIAIYALRTLCSISFHFFIVLIIALVCSWLLMGFANLAVLPLLLPGLVLVLLFGFSIVLTFGILDAFFPDSKHMIQLALQMLFYTLPIIYPLSALRNETFRAILNYNPFGAFIVLLRAPIAEAQAPSPMVWALAAVTTVGSVLFACLLVRVAERRIIFHL